MTSAPPSDVNRSAPRPAPVVSKTGSAMPARAQLSVALLTAGRDKPYALGLASALMSRGIQLDFIGSDIVDAPELHHNSLVKYFNLRGAQRTQAHLVQKVIRVFKYYLRLILYSLTAKPKIFHILWNNKFEFFDRTILMVYYRLLGKWVVLTAHNVNIRKRDGNDTIWNHLTLKAQYHLSNHIFVHTDKMKNELVRDFEIPTIKITVIPFGMNSTVPDTSLQRAEARCRLGLSEEHKTILFFGNIAPYKGLEYLVQATSLLAADLPELRLIIAGNPKQTLEYWEGIRHQIEIANISRNVIQRIEYIPDIETEIYFKAADLLVLPYTHIFQSGVLFLGYNFGVPVVATDVGSLREDVIEEQTGFITTPRDADALARAVQRYFSSQLFAERDVSRSRIRNFACERYSWERVGELTQTVYASALTSRQSNSWKIDRSNSRQSSLR